MLASDDDGRALRFHPRRWYFGTAQDGPCPSPPSFATHTVIVRMKRALLPLDCFTRLSGEPPWLARDPPFRRAMSCARKSLTMTTASSMTGASDDLSRWYPWKTFSSVHLSTRVAETGSALRTTLGFTVAV